MKQGQENQTVILSHCAIPTLLAICEFVAKKMGEPVTPLVMIYTIDTLKDMFYKGKGRLKKGNGYKVWR